MGYNLGCMIGAWRHAVWFYGWVFGIKLSEENIVDIECRRAVVMATNFWTKIAITGFVRTIATRHLVMEGVWLVRRQNAHIADTLLREFGTLPWQPWHLFLAFYIWGSHWRHLANTTEPSVCVAAMRPYVKLLWPLVIIIIRLIADIRQCTHSFENVNFFINFYLGNPSQITPKSRIVLIL